MATPPTGAPQPGDPRSTGPRPPARIRDAGWLAVAILLVVVTAAQAVGLVVALTRPEVELSNGGALLGFIVTAAWLLVIWWLVMGAWRRSVWGCPFDHTTDAAVERRCPRHPLLEG